MKHLSWITRAALFVGFAALASSQDRPPEQAFQTVHLTPAAQPDAENILLTAIKDLNIAIAKAGCKKCGYHLWKSYGEAGGGFKYMWGATWPNRATYEKIHAAKGYNDAWERHPELGKVREGEVYGRFVEVKAGK
jgi:hypothetical protein